MNLEEKIQISPGEVAFCLMMLAHKLADNCRFYDPESIAGRLRVHGLIGGSECIPEITELGEAVVRRVLAVDVNARLESELASARAGLRAFDEQCASREFALSKTEQEWPEIIAVAKSQECQTRCTRVFATAGWIGFVASALGLMFG